MFVLLADGWTCRFIPVWSLGLRSERLLIHLPGGCSPCCCLPSKVLGQLFHCSSAFFPPMVLYTDVFLLQQSQRPHAPSWSASSFNLSCSQFTPQSLLCKVKLLDSSYHPLQTMCNFQLTIFLFEIELLMWRSLGLVLGAHLSRPPDVCEVIAAMRLPKFCLKWTQFSVGMFAAAFPG